MGWPQTELSCFLHLINVLAIPGPPGVHAVAREPVDRVERLLSASAVLLVVPCAAVQCPPVGSRWLHVQATKRAAQASVTSLAATSSLLLISQPLPCRPISTLVAVSPTPIFYTINTARDIAKLSMGVGAECWMSNILRMKSHQPY